MNIAKIMIPKISTVFLHEKDTIRQGLERFMVHGYTAVPVREKKEEAPGFPETSYLKFRFVFPAFVKDIPPAQTAQ